MASLESKEISEVYKNEDLCIVGEKVYESKTTTKQQLLLIDEFRKTLINRSMNEQTSNRVIFNEVLGKPQFRQLTVSFKKYKKQMARAKKNNFPPEPRTLVEFHKQLSGTYNVKTFIVGEPFYVGQTSDKISIVFVAPKIKKLLRSATDIIMDGTFKAEPKFNEECIQLFVIMGISMNYGFPIIYALMSRKNKKAYINLFKFIKNKVCPSWYPKSITVNFEQASIDAIKTVFPLANIHGCWFHHSQSVFRNIQNKGLAELFQDNCEVRDLMHMLMALPLLPSHKIHEGYDVIKQLYNEDLKVHLDVFQRQQMKTIFKYYKNTWITGNFNTILSVNERVRRISNLLEASHRHLMTHINVPNLSPWIFLERIITYCRGTIHDYLLTENGEEIQDQQAKKWKTQDKKIRTASNKLKEMRFSVLEFLKYTKHLTPSYGVLRFDSPFDSYHPDSMSRSPTQPFVSLSIESPASITASRSSSPSLLNSPFESHHSDSTFRSMSQPFNSRFDPNHSDSPSRSQLSSPPLLNPPFESHHSDSTFRSMSQPFNSRFDPNHSDSPSRSPLSSPPLLNPPFESHRSNSTFRSMSQPFNSRFDPNHFDSTFRYASVPLQLQLQLHLLNFLLLRPSLSFPPLQPLNSIVDLNHSDLTILPSSNEDSQFDEPQYTLMSSELSSTSINWNQSNVSYNTRAISPSVNILIADGTMVKQTCVICLESDIANVVLLPCQHNIMCGECMQGLQNKVCPICRITITAFNIYV